MPLKAKASFPSDLPSWVDSRQEQGLYFFTREEAIQTLQFTEEAFKKAAARLEKKQNLAHPKRLFYHRSPGISCHRDITGGMVYR